MTTTKKIHFNKSYTGQAARIITIAVGESRFYALKGSNTGTVFAIGDDKQALTDLAKSKGLAL